MDSLGVLIPIVGELIPLVAIVLGIGIAFWAMYLGHQRKRMQFEERRLMIERGLTPPPMVVDTPKRSPEGYLKNGIVLTFLGIGFAVATALVHNRGLTIAAAIVGFMGLGYLLFYALIRNRPPSLPPTA